MVVSRDRQQSWARLGARARLAELRQEISEILGTYPELRREGGLLTARRGSRRRHLSPEARAAMSEGMRQYWAKRKARSGQRRQTRTA